jgi:hypothetical protein
MYLSSINMTRTPTKPQDSTSAEVNIGHCAIGLEQLAKVAMVSSGGVRGYVSVARVLLRDGLPLYNIDTRTIQVIYLQFPLIICFKFFHAYSRFF